MPLSGEAWKRKPFTRREMLELFRVDPARHDRREIEKRIRAAEYPGASGAYIEAADYKFYVPQKDARAVID